MSDLYTATVQNGEVFCGHCSQRISHPKILTRNGTAKLLECPHCFMLNKVKKQ
jgi:uncharacterized Zn-finger protein